MNPEIEKALKAQLDPGEQLLWSGQPRGGMRLRAQDTYLIPFSIMWGGFAMVWEYVALFGATKSKTASPFKWIMPLWGIPFVAVGLYLIFGRFFIDAMMRARTFYGVTDKRIIIITGLFSKQVKTLQLGTLPEITLTLKNDGSGSIAFGAVPFVGYGVSVPSSWPGSSKFRLPMFEMIENAKKVYDLIRKAQGDMQTNASLKSA